MMGFFISAASCLISFKLNYKTFMVHSLGITAVIGVAPVAAVFFFF